MDQVGEKNERDAITSTNKKECCTFGGLVGAVPLSNNLSDVIYLDLTKAEKEKYMHNDVRKTLRIKCLVSVEWTII